jgi:hypothetical protein
MVEGPCFHPAHQNVTVPFHPGILTPALVFGIQNALEVDFLRMGNGRSAKVGSHDHLPPETLRDGGWRSRFNGRLSSSDMPPRCHFRRPGLGGALEGQS